MKKGRHRRFEEARKLKQSGPEAFIGRSDHSSRPSSDEDEYADIAKRYGVSFDEDDEDDDDDKD